MLIPGDSIILENFRAV